MGVALAALGRRGPGAGVEHPAGAEGDLGEAGAHAALPDERALLVAHERGDRRRPVERGRLADGAAGVDDRREARAGDAQGLEHVVRPLQVEVVEQPGHRGVAGIGDVEPTVRQRPRQPRVDRAEAQVARAVRVVRVQEGGELGGGLVGGQPDAVLAGQREAVEHRAQVLPADGRGDGDAGGAIPQHGRGPLVGDADRIDRAALGEGGAGRGEHRGGHLGGVELDEPGERRARWQSLLVDVGDGGVGLDDGRPQAARPDVDDEDAHRLPLSAARAIRSLRSLIVSRSRPLGPFARSARSSSGASDGSWRRRPQGVRSDRLIERSTAVRSLGSLIAGTGRRGRGRSCRAGRPPCRPSARGGGWRPPGSSSPRRPGSAAARRRRPGR